MARNLDQVRAASPSPGFSRASIILKRESGVDYGELGSQVTTGILGITDYGSAITYAKGDTAYVGDTLYISKQDGNMGNEPASSPSWWEEVTVKSLIRAFYAALT